MSNHDNGLITSQNDTAPKLMGESLEEIACLITSQNDTAPKQAHRTTNEKYGYDYESMVEELKKRKKGGNQ